MKNIKMTAKLMLSYLIIIALAIMIGITGFYGMNSMLKGASDLYDYNLVAVSAMADLRELFNLERNNIRAIFLSKDDPATVQSLLQSFEANDKKAEETFALYDSTIVEGDDETPYYTAKSTYLGSFADMKKEVFALVNSGDYDKAYEFFMDAGPAVATPILEGLAASAAMNNEVALSKNKENGALYQMLFLILTTMLVAAAAVALFFAFYISSIISKPLHSMAKTFTHMGVEGDLDLDPEEGKYAMNVAARKDEIGACVKAALSLITHLQEVGRSLSLVADGDLTVEVKLLSDRDTMGRSLSSMIDSLNNIFGEISSSASQVSTASKQIAEGAQTLAQGSTEQASAAEQLSSSINGIADKTRQNAGIAKEAAKLTGAIRVNAEKGSVQMDQMMLAVREINEASGKIEKVIRVIDDLASQTNILALNASVEAARAGQHGKGFAVVADEVRSLAVKSAEAAKDTSGLIENSIEKANMGLSIATETAASLREIVEGINHSAEIVTQIALSSEEQSAAITQINTGIEQVAQVVQQNSATAEQSAAASQQMSGQSDMLSQLIAQFKLKDAYAQTRLPASTAQKRALRAAGKRATATDEGGFGKY